MKNLHLCFIGLLTLCAPYWTNGQCLTMDVPLENRINKASLIIDGEVIAKKSFIYDKGIYTKNTIKVFRAFKGNVPQTAEITLITLGGQVGDEILVVNPALQVEVGETGMFFMQNWKKDPQFHMAVFDGMGLVSYDLTDRTTSDLFHEYGLINEFITKNFSNYLEVKTFNNPSFEKSGFGRRVNIIINDFTPTTLSAGTDQFVTINGSNFGTTKGNGKVEFRDGNSGGTSWFEAIKYESWFDTLIEVYVPTRAGTGELRVTNDDADRTTTTGDLTVPFANLNATFGDEPNNPYYTQHLQDNGTNNDINWQFNTQFFDSIDAKDGFIRSLETWRCGTLMPWNVTSINTSVSDYEANDGINLVTWDHSNALPTNVLGRCYSRWRGCGATGNRSVYVNELDIVFNINRNWHYGLNNASGGKLDFVSVCAHELGHAHQLGHVIDPAKMMHFSIGANQTKRNLSNGDIDGANLVHTRSVNSICGRTQITLLNPNNCSLVSSEADFAANRTEACLEETIVFSDSTSGAATAWDWNFGAGATPATANGSGPHSVSYSTGGTKDVSLTITTLGGPKTETKVDYLEIANDPRINPKVRFSNWGNNRFRFYVEDGIGNTHKWYIPAQSDTASADTVFIGFSAPGNYTVALLASNECNDTTVFINLTDWTSVDNVDLGKITLFPNPAKNVVNISSTQYQFSNYSIYDLTGKVIQAGELLENKVDLRKITKGVYLFKLHDQKHSISTKLIVQ